MADGTVSGADRDESGRRGASDHSDGGHGDDVRSGDNRSDDSDTDNGYSDNSNSDNGDNNDSSGGDDRQDYHDRGYGDGWEELRQQTLRRDNYACTRCGADDRTLQAHHIVPRSAGGPDELENLLTLCRPCHGVIHQHNNAFDDVRDDAPLFPERTAPDPVARLRTPADQCCTRCGAERSDPTELVAWTDVPASDDGRPAPSHVTLCKPCAGLLIERDSAVEKEVLTANHTISVHELAARRTDAPVRPSAFALSQVGIRREPRTLRERVVDDTPLRFLLNHRGIRLALLVAVGYVALFVVLAL
ncbi:HNH endonuclease [Natrialba hulunbeirensis JCM 10989]|uniref:HNH endonuclease n=1 Tax=Natrialba hulunbeirensis JCM 10989 TaxID=1227493 RepID=M0ACV3_9EURY|nr:HNH endonuclease [Natrialba hulunbeirensis]ELY95178.1 HNH endonuclease [Natrialba hulunbeirensis JCM 10989]